MKVLKIIRDRDVGWDDPNPDDYKKRGAARAVVFDDDNKIVLLNITKKISISCQAVE